MKPNMLFILIDDMGWKDLGVYGSTFYETPNIDRLCREGMRFTNAYAACPVCSPTRASLMTGKYPASIGVTNWIGGLGKGKLLDAPYVRQLPLEERSLATVLKENGYQTWHVGKWHLGERAFYPDKHGFDVNIGGCDWGYPKQGHFAPYGIETLPEGPEGEYLADRLTDEAVRLIQNSDGTPFFLNLWHYAVHIPVQAPTALVEKYQKKRVNMGLDKCVELEEGELFPTEVNRTKHILRRRVQSDPVYAAMIENLDTNIGRIGDALKEKGIDDDTVIFFYSDNGGLSTTQGSPTSNAPLSQGKGWMYEGGVRAPLIVRWKPLIKGNSVCDTPVTTPDLFPTILHLAGVPVEIGTPTGRLDGVDGVAGVDGMDGVDSVAGMGGMDSVDGVDGVDLYNLLIGGNIDERPIFWHYPHYGDQGGTPAAAVRQGDWKLIRFFEDNRNALYHLRDDISEENDLSHTWPDITARLEGVLNDWLASVEAKMPMINPDYNIASL